MNDASHRGMRVVWGAPALLTFALQACFTVTSAGDGSTFLWTVKNVVDGDTTDVSRGGTTEQVRLVGIDSPELD